MVLLEGQSVFYNNIAIGQIVKQHLSVDGVKFEAAIAAEYRNLIHENTQFVAASNFDVSFGIDGLRFESATPSKWLQGGVRVLPKKEVALHIQVIPFIKISVVQKRVLRVT